MRSLASAALVALALVFAACGEDEDEPATQPTATEATTITDPTTITDDTGLPEQRCPEAESPPNITNVISYGADCGAVADAMAEITSVSRQFRIGDFECTRVEGTRLSGIWECRGEASYFTFTFGD